MATESKSIVLSAEQEVAVARIRPAAASLAKADREYELAIPQAAMIIAKIVEPQPGKKTCTLEFWEVVRKEFLAGYIAEYKVAEGTANNRWSAIAVYMEKHWEIKKPAAVTVEAKRKQAARAKEEKAVKAAKAKFVKPADAFEAAAKLAAQGKAEEARIVTKAAHELSADNIKNAGKQANDKLKQYRDQLREQIGKCADVEALAAALEILKYGKSVVAAADAKKASKAAQKENA